MEIRPSFVIANGVKQSRKTLDYSQIEERERRIATLTLAMTFKGNALLGQYNPPRLRLREPCERRGDPEILTFIITLFIR